jgi:phenylacetate-CoA ligase
MRLPALLAGASYRAHERIVRRPTFSYLAELERTQWLSRAKIEALQLEKLRGLLTVARAHCPWHRRRLDAAGFGAGLESLADFARLPRMTKQDAATNRDEMTWRGVPGGIFKYNTGGSSGQPLIFYFGRARQASDAAGRMRARRWWGVEPGDPEVYLWGAPVELGSTDLIKTIRDRLINQLMLNAFAMSSASMDDYLDALERFSPRCVFGYASSLALLAAHTRERRRKLQLNGLRVVCTTGEPLYGHQRTLITEAFGAPVASEFGSRDIGFTAHENPQGQSLLISESIVLEVLDEAGKAVPPGAMGEAVLTGLCSRAQPFIRYRTGDMVRMSEEADRGGRGLHVIAEVVGRSTDFLVRSDGTIMHALAVIYVLRAVEGVAEFKLIQHSVRDVQVLVVPDNRWTPEAAQQIEAGLTHRLGHDVRVTVQMVEAIPAEASGKYRYVVSHVPLAGDLGHSTASRGTRAEH